RRHVVGPGVGPRHAAIGDRADLRMVEAVDHIQHRSLAGAVRADDRQDLVLADLEGDVADRPHPAERQADVVDLEKDVADLLVRERHVGTGPLSAEAAPRLAAHPSRPAAEPRRARIVSATLATSWPS